MNESSRQTAALSPVPGSRRGKPGRPRKGDHGIFRRQESGHNAGTATPKPHVRTGDSDGTQVRLTVVPVCPRLLDLHATAAYLGLSEFTVRELEGQGILSRIRIPLQDHGELRKLLFDKQELDRLVEAWKERADRA